MTEKPPEDRTGETTNIMIPRLKGKHTLFQLSRMAALVTCMGMLGADAYALALGRIAVLSALGEPLRAEIDIPDINPEEASSLRTSVGSIDAFKRAGLEFNPLLSNVRVTLQRRPDGRSYLQLTGERAINEPYLDLVVEANWAAGRLVRDYTMLFDPPNTRAATAPVQVNPTQTAPAVSVDARQPVRPVAPALAPAATARPPAASRQPAQRTEATSKTPSSAKEASAGSDVQQVKVRAGDTASKIAAAVKPSSISLDQMLVALLRANPDAFGAGNVNRLKAGAVLTVPTTEAAQGTSVTEASQIIVAQSRDFNDFRRKLAEGTRLTQAEASKRESKGVVQANLEEKKPGATSPDKLSLQKGELNGKSTEDKLAKELQAKEEAKRLAELNKNIAELQKLASAPSTVASGPGSAAPVAKTGASTGVGVAVSSNSSSPETVTPTNASAASAPAVTPSAASSLAVAPTASAAASELAAAASTVAASAASTPKPPASQPAPAVPGIEEPSLVSDLLENPLIPAVAGGLVALLAGLGIYRIRQRKKSNQVDSSFMESRLQPDSFFGASGGQKIDTNEAALSGSSMMYSPSQLDAGADVDPVAEADVYLAYGRDLQAEEILKEALRSNPSRAAIHFKLLQIYAKRRDVKGYAVTAADAYKLSNGLGPEWAQACEVGRELDPTNPLYQGDLAHDLALGSEVAPDDAAPMAAGPDSAFAATNINLPTADVPSSSAAVDLDLDLDLDFSEPVTPPVTEEVATEPTISLDLANSSEGYAGQSNTAPLPLPDLEIDLAEPEGSDASPALVLDTVSLPSLDFDTPQATPEDTSNNALEFDSGLLDNLQSRPAPEATPVAADAAHQALEFDLDSISLELGQTDATAAEPEVPSPDNDGLNGEDPLVTKLALAEEFQAIGDDDGARTLAQEVADTATGNLKAKAQRFLAELG